MASMQRMPPTRPYRDFLTPALHRRFTSAALLALAVCYGDAVWLGDWSRYNLVWPWLPFGRALIKTLLLFLSALSIYVLRVARLHVGARTTTYPLETFWRYIFSFGTIYTLFWYSVSAWVFSEVYIWSAPATANLGRVAHGKLHERSRLNERPIYLRTNFFILAIAQSIMHLYRDYDRLVLPTTSLKTAAASKEAPQIAPPLAQIQKRFFNILLDSGLQGSVTTIFGGCTYYLLLRGTVWSWTYAVSKYFTSIPRASGPTGVSDLGDMVLRVAVEGVVLTVLWEVSNAAFAANVAQEPLKKGQPLTADSKDPNGSLIAGLKAKKEVPRNFAFWELLLIAQRFDLRRNSLFQDIDRKGGPAWTQILAVSLSEVQGITKRISECQQPPSSAAASQQQQPIHYLPKISQPLKQDNIFASAPPPTTPFQAVQASTGQAVKSIGQSPGADPITPKAKKLIEYGTNTLLTKEQRESLSQTTVKNKANSYLTKTLRTPLGLPFRQTFRRRATAVVHGVPHSALNTIIYAINALTTLAVRSIKEDTLGQVAKDVPTIIRVFADTIRNIENFMQTLSPHWTDVEFDEKSSRRVKEVDEVTDALRSGLEQLLLVFGEFADSLGLSKGELRGAKELVAGGGSAEKGKQMEQRS